MKIAVLGAAGRTGTAAVREARRRGHDVVAVARRTLADLPVGVQSASADVTNAEAVEAALNNADAVISAVGIGSARTDTQLYSEGTRATLAAMMATGGRRLVVVSASPAGPREDHRGLQRRIILPILEWFYGATYRDMRRMELVLADATIDWVAVRPPRLLTKKPKGTYHLGLKPGQIGRDITIPDLAAALVDLAEKAQPTGAFYISN